MKTDPVSLSFIVLAAYLVGLLTPGLFKREG